MRRSDALRQDDSARTYLESTRTHSALRTTVALAADTLGFPIGQVNILDSREQHTVASVGPREYGVLPRREALCDAVAHGGAPVVHEDLTHGPVPGAPHPPPDFGSYAGVPLVGREGLVIGTLCVMAPEARSIPADVVDRLVRFGVVVQEQLELLRRTGGGGAVARGALQARDLAAAIDAGQVQPWFQPVVDLAGGGVVGYEALARWEHPALGVIGPAAFVPLAEDSDIIIDLDLAVFAGALDRAWGWLAADPGLTLGVNVSGYHVTHPRSLERFADQAQQAGVALDRITLELTETAVVVPGSFSAGVVQRLRDTGFGVVLDDFGTSWSSLEQLLALPVDGIKLDRVVAASLGTEKGDAVVRAVTSLAAELGLTTVIEGIESQSQADRALELGCTSGQGYLWSAPVPAADVEAELEDASRGRHAGSARHGG